MPESNETPAGRGQGQDDVHDGVWEALQRLIESAEMQGVHSQEDALLVARHRRALLGQRHADGSSLVMAPGVAVQSYLLPDGCTIERCPQRAGQIPAVLWAVRAWMGVLSRDGGFEYEPPPSERTPEFLARCRFETAQQAFDAWKLHHQATQTGANESCIPGRLQILPTRRSQQARLQATPTRE